MYKYTKDGNRHFVSISNHCDLAAAIRRCCEDLGIRAGEVYGIGAVSEAVLRFLDPATKQYVDKSFVEQMEIANLTGNVSEKDGEVYLHLHAVLGRSDYSAVAGHLLTAKINGACEIVIIASDARIGRYADDATGLNLWEFK